MSFDYCIVQIIVFGREDKPNVSLVKLLSHVRRQCRRLEVAGVDLPCIEGADPRHNPKGCSIELTHSQFQRRIKKWQVDMRFCV